LKKPSFSRFQSNSPGGHEFYRLVSRDSLEGEFSSILRMSIFDGWRWL
jgi:hypothetical protein